MARLQEYSQPMTMLPKPAHLDVEYARQFSDPSVVAAYHHRPPYPSRVVDQLVGLLVEPKNGLDAGTGTGEIARALALRAVRVDALDPSIGMLERGRQLPGGEDPRLTWMLGAAEDAPLRPPYGLITTAASLHWMAWDVVLPRFRDLLAPGGVLAVVDQLQLATPWDAGLGDAIARYSTNRHFRPYDLIEELERRELFRPIGRMQTDPEPFFQPIAEYVESFHARNGFSRDRMSRQAAAAFDAEVARLVGQHARDGLVELQISGRVVWGLPGPTTKQLETQLHPARPIIGIME